MSAAKMVADSTQSDTDSRKRRHRSAGRREKKSKKDRRRRRTSSSSSRSRSRSRSSSESRHSRSASNSGSEEHDSDVDLQKDLKPLGAYLKNPAELLDQMLHSVRGSSLQRALPDILKDMPVEELRKRCLEHLEVLSRKRMRRILAGDDPTTISSSGTDDDSSDEEKAEAGADDSQADSTAVGAKDSNTDAVPVSAKAGGGDSPLSLAAEDLEDNPQQQHPVHQRQPQAELQVREEEMEEGEVGEQVDADDQADDDDEDEEGMAESGDDMADVLFPMVEQDKMDLLELEMRARAIKAMLALHEQREKVHKKIKKK